MKLETALELADYATSQEELQFLEATQGPTYAMNDADINAFLDA